MDFNESVSRLIVFHNLVHNRNTVLKISSQNIIRFSFQTNATCIKSLLSATCRVTLAKRETVTLIVTTTSDPASINPAAALLAMPGWTAGPILPPDMKSFVNKQTRVIQHDGSIVKEDDLDSWWEEAASIAVDEVIFLSRHTAVSNRPALTVHPIGVLHLKEEESPSSVTPPQGGKPGWAALTSPRIGPWLRLLKKMAEAYSLVPEFEITLEGTHHGPITSKPTMFLENGDTEEYWKRQDAAQVMALVSE
ncbi:BnaCnng46480D [Brassica napus]|uniref:BnaCnng46480D protein n=1 Tax=Brassica napus TaxID=3708 RepID=A0A078JFS6_BRANA|nr:BnaCnng46480D [Brassica napus]